MHLQTYSCSQLSFMSSCCVGDVFDQHHLVHSDRWAAASAAAASRVVTEKTFTVGEGVAFSLLVTPFSSLFLLPFLRPA
jgi:hypothetical protein